MKQNISKLSLKNVIFAARFSHLLKTVVPLILNTTSDPSPEQILVRAWWYYFRSNLKILLFFLKEIVKCVHCFVIICH